MIASLATPADSPPIISQEKTDSCMLDGLDDIPWETLTHAYGTAEDVPDLLRSLRTAPADLKGEDSPLWHLFGNIWHQGTVYEATAHAVPFLIELASRADVPDRIGILMLLADIARGSSYLDVHGNMMNKPDVAERRAEELKWVEQAHAAVARGVTDLLTMTEEESDVRLAAAHVLALLPEHREDVSARLRSMMDKETGSLQRTGLLLLLGLAGDRSEATLSLLDDAFSGDDLAQRRGAAFASSYLRRDPLPKLARAAILEAIAADDTEDSFDALPWAVEVEIDREILHACLDSTSREHAASTAIAAIETGKAHHGTVSTVLHLIFPRFPLRPHKQPPLTSKDLSPLQKRAVHAMLSAMEGGKRIYDSSFEDYGLPEKLPGWRALAGQNSIIHQIRRALRRSC